MFAAINASLVLQRDSMNASPIIAVQALQIIPGSSTVFRRRSSAIRGCKPKPPKIPSSWVSGFYRLVQSSLVDGQVSNDQKTPKALALPKKIRWSLVSISTFTVTIPSAAADIRSISMRLLPSVTSNDEVAMPSQTARISLSRASVSRLRAFCALALRSGKKILCGP